MSRCCLRQQKEEGGDKQRKGRFRDNDGLAALLAVSIVLLTLCATRQAALGIAYSHVMRPSI